MVDKTKIPARIMIEEPKPITCSVLSVNLSTINLNSHG
jgi:hypothetical protein